MSKAAPRKFDHNDGDVQIGQPHARDMRVDGPAEDSLDPQIIEVVSGPDFKDLAEQLAFMEEKVEVVVHPSADKNSSPIVEVWNNGRSQRFVRGRSQVVRRKFVYELARAKETSYQQEDYMDGNGDRAIRNNAVVTPRYPFAIRRDDNPKGRDWLIQILNEA